MATPTIESAVLGLRAMVKALKKRSDIVVDSASLGRKSSKKALAIAQTQFSSVLDGELLQFFALMNGAEVKWRYVEGTGGGSMKIPPFEKLYRFEAENEHFYGFGDDKEALMFDMVTDEGISWIVRDAGSDSAGALIFALPAEGAAGFSFDSLAAYLTAAVEAGVVIDWPMQGNQMFHNTRQWLEKYQAAPVKPQKIRTGMRVQNPEFMELGRGAVVDVFEVEPWESRTLPNQRILGTRFARVELDVGETVWIPANFLRQATAGDAYEQLRTSLDAEDIHLLTQKLCLALGPRDNARRGAALLAKLSIDEAFEVVFKICDEIVEAGIDLRKVRTLEPDEQAFSKKEWDRTQFQLACVTDGLLGGLHLRLQQAAWIQNKNDDVRSFLPTPAGEKLESYIQPLKPSWGAISRLLSRDCRLVSDSEFCWARPCPKEAKQLGLPTDISLVLWRN